MEYDNKKEETTMGQIVKEGNAFYEIDEACLQKRKQENAEKERRSAGTEGSRNGEASKK